ncbi:unnamed protein product [Eruca vesicaria subsp. sativa]|uniref:Uncharacterized protein n=1 Tax=Eruca vesicaria subsp. sativa TaxID=29727 RepID=A0ABC8J611_ERUVS|nr:unnamed protein product [Eruca vesicaria subsp. sativa]
MDLKSGSSNRNRKKGYGGRKLCACRLSAKVFTAWTNKDPGGRKEGIRIVLTLSGLMENKLMVGQREL